MTEQDHNARTGAEGETSSAASGTEKKRVNPEAEKTSASVNTQPAATPADTVITHHKGGVAGIALGIVAIAIALALSGTVFHYGKAQSSSLETENTHLRQQIADIQQQQAFQQRAVETALSRQSQALQDAAHQQALLTQQLGEMKDKVDSLSGNDARVWLIAQADFLVKMAGRKLWSDQDITTAAALLKSADASLSEMNDPSLIPVRRALTSDISSLSTLSQIDYDGIILKLNQLSNNVDNLRLADNYQDDAPMDADSNELSGDLHEWRENLLKSWHSFMDSFITIRRRDDTAVPLLAPNQDIYLRENIRSRLLIAAQAVPRHQEEIYQQSLENVSTWVRAYYDTSDTATKVFLSDVDSLMDQNISMDVPQTLQSQALLEKLMQTRVRHFLTQSETPAVSEKEAVHTGTIPAEEAAPAAISSQPHHQNVIPREASK